MTSAVINKRGAAGGGAESADMPILCETCLGPNPYVRMSKQGYGKECKICDRPFTVFRWNPGTGMRFKKTEICTTCAKIKSVCQTCVLDLQYGLPVQVRDTALGITEKAPTSDINKQYYVNRMEQQLEGGASSLVGSSAGPSSRAGQDMLRQLARSRADPMGRGPGGADAYRRNKPHLCSFFAKGNCTRGDACPFRHELPVDNELAKQNIQDRYHGRNDPVARKILSGHAKAKGLEPPEDKEVTSLFLSSLPESINEDTIRTFFLTSTPNLRSDDIRSVTLVSTSKCAFVNFRTRQAAETAAERCAIKVELGGKEVRVAWGRSRPGAAGKKASQSGSKAEDGRDFGVKG